MTSNRPRPPDEDPEDELLPESMLIALRSDKAERYRRKAAEVRTAADEVRDVTSRRTLTRIAEDYERLATRSERRQRGPLHGPGSRNHR
jgi:hypothetical protein